VSQVDLVPTISLMLGIPVPFSNLGTVIVDLFDYDPLHSNHSLIRMKQKLTALQLNAQQVQHFLHKYGEQSNDLPQFELDQLDEEFSLAENQLKELFSDIQLGKTISDRALAGLAERYIYYLSQVRDLCRSVWSKFDLLSMAVGGVVIICAFLFNVAITVCETQSTPLSAVMLSAGSCIALCSVANLLQLVHPSFILLITMFAIVLFLTTSVVFIAKHFLARLFSGNCCFRVLEIFSVLLCCIHSVSLLSNSFVVYEDRSTMFLVQSLTVTLLVVQTFVVPCHRLSIVDPASKRRVPKEFPWPSVHILLLFAALAICIRMSAVFSSCREEQVDCEMSLFAQPLSAILVQFEHFRLARLSMSVISVIAVIAVVTMWLRHCGNLNGLEPSMVAVRYIMPLMGLSLCMYWLVDGFLLHNSTGRLIAAGVTALPRLVYVLSLAIFVVVAVSPLCLLVLRPQQNPSIEEENIDQLRNVSYEELITQIYGHVRKNWRSVLTTEDPSPPSSDNTPVVYGLATVYSSGHIVLLTAVAMVIMLVLGDNMAPSVALWMICEICLLELHAVYVHCWSDEGILSILSRVYACFWNCSVRNCCHFIILLICKYFKVVFIIIHCSGVFHGSLR